MAGRGRGRGRGGRGPAGELLRDMGEDLGLASIHPDGGEDDGWPPLSLPTARPISDAEREQIGVFRRLTRRARGSVGFRFLKKAALASTGLSDDGPPAAAGAPVDVQDLVESLAVPRSSLKHCIPEALLRAPRERPRPPDDAPRPAKRPRAASDVAALAERLVTSEEKEEGKDDEEEAAVEEDVEEDEPDDYMRDYYDEDNDALEGDDNEPVF